MLSFGSAVYNTWKEITKRRWTALIRQESVEMMGRFCKDYSAPDMHVKAKLTQIDLHLWERIEKVWMESNRLNKDKPLLGLNSPSSSNFWQLEPAVWTLLHSAALSVRSPFHSGRSKIRQDVYEIGILLPKLNWEMLVQLNSNWLRMRIHLQLHTIVTIYDNHQLFIYQQDYFSRIFGWDYGFLINKIS